MFYNHQEIEKKWQKYWEDNQVFKSQEPKSGVEKNKPKFYVLDMFPYPSGAGLHVGHPLGYIASDIYARYKRHQGYNVLHPIGYDSFGLPAEQYAIQTGQHPAVTTENNITRYEEQLRKIGFSFDWSRELRTSDTSYYKWTQWIFIQLFHSWYNKDTDRAESIDTLIAQFEAKGTEGLNAVQTDELSFTSEEWNSASEQDKQDILLNYRLAYRAETTVNWCPALGTVLANDEVKDGKSERGGYPVFQKKMMQWSMRITAYSERLLQGLNTLDWPQPLKDSQEYWIGKSQGALVQFSIDGLEGESVEVFTTRPDTIFGVSFMVLAPEHHLVEKLTTEEQKNAINQYIEETSKKTERDRMADVKSVSGAFTGSYVTHPFTRELIPIYISDYVLMGYGTGAVMAVPAHDDRDHRFAKYFGLPIKKVVATDIDVQEESFDSKESTCVNSEFLDGLNYKDAKQKIIQEIEKLGIGKGTTNYRQRDAIFSRQRYWGEPVPIYYKEDMPYTLPLSALPLELPEVEKYLPTEDGDPPLGNAKTFAWDEVNQRVASVDLIDNKKVFPMELSTMPGWAGSSWYFLRYMDSTNDEVFCAKEKTDYWGQVDLYIGGSEHATGHLLYARFWNMFLKDRGFISHEEPFQKLINQGMILGMSAFVFRVDGTNQFVSKNLAKDYQTQKIHVDVSLLKGTSDELDTDAFKQWRPEFKDAEFILEGGKYITEREVEKMSKSKYNVVNPDDICEEYGADCLRLYEMFLGPLEQSKPWNTQGLSGVYGFLKKFYNLYFDGDKVNISDEEPTKEEYKALHTLIKKVKFDIDNFSFNTSVSSFMIAVNELQKLKTNKRKILEPLAVVISPYAPHICEELWQLLGYNESIEFVEFPVLNEEYLKEDEIEYPVSFNGKMRFKLPLPADLSKEEIEKIAIENDKVLQYLDGNGIKKIIVVPKKIINIVF
ncbi:leucine--tRNA ligase [Riemerella anatipestifer]|uniref:Leucine--tRNA ligase n=1 Tax=Riemerella anatipestifer RA-CH-1 TaxID=1228997 RepID=J9R1A4_RIEAN|nr:leucine--tRNA ligase [Riemerella anatipestifer]AFR35529.1 Leucyl-tRNA synthetase [Riemerella anatipestifer RA-CH-1]AIH02566.1 leucyl-tRNA synthetase [Riemerella anatipestifer CH3]MCO7331902.1 leucine--tRNA ligase [Riemerella anatipestifer]MCO7350789.1 leucine--tRNA ligase [Riemerella anatipestifer]MCU7583334.1 leucine--tRNA ligase [Riemerella anatipestifer]